MTVPHAPTPPPAPPPPSAAGPLEWTALAERACAETRLSDFGDEADFKPALERLLQSLRDEADLNDAGHRLAWTRTLSALKNRLWTESCLRAHPEIDQAPLAAPIVVIGPQGSGTTRLHRLLASDARLAHLRSWEALNPAPRVLPAWPPHGPDVETRRRQVQADAVHPVAADTPAEETLLLDQSFCGLTALGLFDMPGWWRAFAGADRSAAYRTLARQLRLVAWTRGDPTGRRWLLKAPQHMLDLPALLAVFPDARLVFVHRDPLKSVAAALSTMVPLAAPQTDRDCRSSVRNTWLDVYETSARRCIEARALLAPQVQFDLHQEELNGDWRAAVARVQAFAGLAPDAEAEGAMRDWLACGTPPTRAARFRPSQVQDLDEAALEARFAFVRERYGIARE